MQIFFYRSQKKWWNFVENNKNYLDVSQFQSGNPLLNQIIIFFKLTEKGDNSGPIGMYGHQGDYKRKYHTPVPDDRTQVVYTKANGQQKWKGEKATEIKQVLWVGDVSLRK